MAIQVAPEHHEEYRRQKADKCLQCQQPIMEGSYNYSESDPPGKVATESEEGHEGVISQGTRTIITVCFVWGVCDECRYGLLMLI
jgi:hypothetical protein